MKAQFIVGSAHNLPELKDRSIHAIITSPPYFGLRAYEGDQAIEWPSVEYAPMAGLAPIHIQGCNPDCEHEWNAGPRKKKQAQRDHDGRDFGPTRGEESHRKGIAIDITQGVYCQRCDGWRGPLGLEPNIESYIGHLILCLREWRRILRDDGTVWLNLGDSYSGSGAGGGGNRKGNEHGQHNIFAEIGRPQISTIKPKNLLLVPARLALAAQADGWIVRSDIIWDKKNPLPESVTDRPTKSHEYIFLLAKNERYFYDARAIAEPAISAGETVKLGAKSFSKGQAAGRGIEPSGNGKKDSYEVGQTRNARSVWTVNTQPYPEAHFAVWPKALVEPMVRASTSQWGVCATCKAPYERIIEKPNMNKRPTRSAKSKHEIKDIHISNNWAGVPKSAGQAYQKWRNENPDITAGWQRTCKCETEDMERAVILDPFCGSGTTGEVAIRLGRDFVGVDLSETYINDFARERAQTQLAFEVE